MLKEVLGGDAAEKTLLYLEAYGSGYAKAISDTFGLSWSQVQKQLDKFEAGGVLVAESLGRSRVYRFNPRYFFLKELRALIKKALDHVPPVEREKYFQQRRRPRRKGKPLLVG